MKIWNKRYSRKNRYSMLMGVDDPTSPTLVLDFLNNVYMVES
jgi:hypothetical protein